MPAQGAVENADYRTIKCASEMRGVKRRNGVRLPHLSKIQTQTPSIITWTDRN